jgi:hypothetical protein
MTIIRQREPLLRGGIAHDVTELVVGARDGVPSAEKEAVALQQSKRWTRRLLGRKAKSCIGRRIPEMSVKRAGDSMKDFFSPTPWKKPSRVWASFLRWLRSWMRPSQRLETHLERQIDLAGTRERISARRSSVRLSPVVSPGLAREDLHKCKCRRQGR